jgi:hypothetical protein
MIKKIFTIRDQKAEAYLNPTLMRTSGEFLRAIEELANDPDHQFHKHSSDYSLWCVGEYDELTGVVTPYKEHETLGKVVDYVKNPVNYRGPKSISRPDEILEEEG